LANIKGNFRASLNNFYKKSFIARLLKASPNSQSTSDEQKELAAEQSIEVRPGGFKEMSSIFADQ
jgi:hypothetical protein